VVIRREVEESGRPGFRAGIVYIAAALKQLLVAMVEGRTAY
jgi:hypothetical protein